MVLLTLVHDKVAGRSWVGHHFPLVIGRSANAHMQVEADGVWDRHASIELGETGYVVSRCGDALVSVNGERVAASRLRNGDLIELGSARVRFNLAPLPQYSLRLPEWGTWLGWSILFLVQLGLIHHFFD